MARKKDHAEYSTPRLRQILAWVVRRTTSGNVPTVSQLGRTYYTSDKLGYAPEPWNISGVHAMTMANRLQRLGLVTLYKHAPGFPTFINLTEHGIMVYAAHIFDLENLCLESLDLPFPKKNSRPRKKASRRDTSCGEPPASCENS